MNETQVYETLKLILNILNSHNIKYWFEGSIIPASVNGALYRKINDLDILIDRSQAEVFTNELLKLGYTQKNKNIYRVADQLGVRVFTHPTLLEVGYFSLSLGEQEYEIKSGPIKVTVPKSLLTDTQYTFKDLSFNGISLEGMYTLALLSKNNPKRKHEFELYKKLNLKPLKWPIYDFYLFGIKCNWLVDVLNLGLVIIGKLRVLFKKPYDPWRH